MLIRLPYACSFLEVQIPANFGVDIIDIPATPPAPDPLGVVHQAVDNLLGQIAWVDFARARSVAIAVNDKTRPVPHRFLLPPLLDRLVSLGIPDEAIIFYVAVGTHPPMRPEEFSTILPTDILARYKVVSHDSENDDDLMFLGETTRGTPVWSNRGYMQSDLKIVVGNIEPHQFVGFSGGVKSAAVGLSGLDTINKNHTLMAHPDSQLGTYATNPARADIEEIGAMVGVDLALNAILNHHKELVQALAGDPVAVMEAGVPLSRQVSQVEVPQKYSLTIVSPGGHPKDINVYQSQKGLAHAARVTCPGGTIILAAACTEGAGSPHYEEWALGKKSYAEVIQEFKFEGFRIGPHKAFQIARDASNFNLMTYSELNLKLAQRLLLNPIPDLQTAIDAALVNFQPGDRVGVLPHAAATIPYLQVH